MLEYGKTRVEIVQPCIFCGGHTIIEFQRDMRRGEESWTMPPCRHCSKEIEGVAVPPKEWEEAKKELLNERLVFRNTSMTPNNLNDFLTTVLMYNASAVERGEPPMSINDLLETMITLLGQTPEEWKRERSRQYELGRKEKVSV